MPPSKRNERSVFVVLPAYNEAANVGAVLEALVRTGREARVSFHAIVVDDGSEDGTAEVARGSAGCLPMTLVRHPSNMGLGTTIRDGLFKAVELAADGDVVVTMDADDTHAPAAILSMVDKIDEGFDVLIASRYRQGSQTVGVPWVRRAASCLGSTLCRILFPIPGVRDYTCGYRGYRAVVLREAIGRYRHEFVNQDGFQCMVDILLKLSRMGLRFGEIPLILRYDRKSGKSKMKVLPTAWRTLKLLIRRKIEFRR